MSDTLDTIDSQCGAGNSPGFSPEIHFIEKKYVSDIPEVDPGTLKVSTDIVLEATKVFHVFNVSTLEQGFKVTPEGDIDSSVKKAELEFFIGGISPEKSHVLQTNSNGCPLIAILVDKKGTKRLLGDELEGAYLEVSEEWTPKKGYKCKLYYSSNLGPLYYEGVIVN